MVLFVADHPDPRRAPVRMNPTRTFGFLLKDLGRLYVQRFEQRAAVHGLTLPQCKALVYLAINEGISQVQLAELTEIEPMSLVRILDHMASEELVERRNDPADRRARCLYLKSKAKPLVDEIWHWSELTLREALVGIPKRQSDLAISVLEKIHANLLSQEPLTARERTVPSP
jgi:MarR family transcriptional regulator, transcriptional regulator for hemolysin